ncbi:MAG: hypothetical protein AAB152_04050 [Candidatus Coatesbacteria bacterium]
MYFLRVRPLKEQLAREGLSESDRFRYLLAWMLLVTLSSISATSHSATVVFLLFVITVAGVVWAWRRNGGTGGHAILDRYFSIGFVVNLRVMLVLLAVAAVVNVMPPLRETLDSLGTLFGYLGGSPDSDETVAQPWSELLGLAAETWIAWSIGRHIGQVGVATASSGAIGATAAYATPTGPVTYTIPPTGITTQAKSSDRLDRFVDRLVQSEIQQGQPIEAGTAVTAPRRKVAKQSGRAAAAKRIKAWRRDHGRR